jgi:hypothetical protein
VLARATHVAVNAATSLHNLTRGAFWFCRLCHCRPRTRPCQCGFRNFASRSECFKCHAPR